MKNDYKNREVIKKQESLLGFLTYSERHEYFCEGSITVSNIDPTCEKRIEEKLTSRVEVHKYNLENLLGSEYYRSGIAVDGVPVTYFINMEFGIVSMIRFSDNTILISCEDCGFYSSLIGNLEKSLYKFDVFDSFVRINLNKDEYKASNIYRRITSKL